MKELQEFKQDMTALLLEIESYGAKQTKVLSARIRKGLGGLKNSVTAVRAALVAEDKK